MPPRPRLDRPPPTASPGLTVPNVSTVTGATYLIVVYCQGYQSSCGSNNSKASVATGSGTPFASSPASTNLASEGTGTIKDCVELIQATGNGTSGTVTVNGNGGNVVFAEVIRITGSVLGTPAVQQGMVSPATAAISAAGNWIVPVAVTDGSGTSSITPPSGWSLLGNPMQSTTTGADLWVYFNTSTAAGSASFGLTPNTPSNGWATIAAHIG